MPLVSLATVDYEH